MCTIKRDQKQNPCKLPFYYHNGLEPTTIIWDISENCHQYLNIYMRHELSEREHTSFKYVIFQKFEFLVFLANYNQSLLNFFHNNIDYPVAWGFWLKISYNQWSIWHYMDHISFSADRRLINYIKLTTGFQWDEIKQELS